MLTELRIEGYAIPHPVWRFPCAARFREGRLSQPSASAATFMTATDRSRLNPVLSAVLAVRNLRRDSSGSALSAPSMNDSEANVDCGSLGSIQILSRRRYRQ